MNFRKPLLWLLPLAVLLHLNFWMWESHRLVWGWPVNLLYHALLSLAWSAVMLALVHCAWPSNLED